MCQCREICELPYSTYTYTLAVADVGSQGVRRPVWIGYLPLAGNPGGTAAFQIGELTLSTPWERVGSAVLTCSKVDVQ